MWMKRSNNVEVVSYSARVRKFELREYEGKEIDYLSLQERRKFIDKLSIMVQGGRGTLTAVEII